MGWSRAKSCETVWLLDFGMPDHHGSLRILWSSRAKLEEVDASRVRSGYFLAGHVASSIKSDLGADYDYQLASYTAQGARCQFDSLEPSRDLPVGMAEHTRLCDCGRIGLAYRIGCLSVGSSE